MHNQIFGIALTELTSLLARRSVYCSKYANSEHSIGRFKTKEGYILYTPMQHSWQNGRCQYCGASKEVFDRGDAAETYAYNFIHTNNPEKFFPNMTFDVIIGNPPYQMDDGGAQASATPIYNLFVEQALKLKPRYLSMIIPARWYGGGKGLDDFRKLMIEDKHIRVLHDYLDAGDCFPGVEIKGGVCYFLWNRDQQGTCTIYTHKKDEIIEQEPRFLKEKGSDVFIRYTEGVSVLHKVRKQNENTLDTIVSSQKPFGLRTYVHGESKKFEKAVTLYERGGIGYINKREIVRNRQWVDVYKVYISAAYNAGDSYPHQILGKPIIGPTNSCCTETYVVIGPVNTQTEAQHLCEYISTKFFRFLVMLKKTSQHAPSSVYHFVPLQDFSEPWTDEKLYKKYNLSSEEIAFIESMIRPME
jgi:site-specific DNA-methyltransferase (adenine-specific)